MSEPARVRCKGGVMDRGRRFGCGAYALKGGEWCNGHDPERQRARAAKMDAAVREHMEASLKKWERERQAYAALARIPELEAEVERLRAALVAAAEHHDRAVAEEKWLVEDAGYPPDEDRIEYHAERAAILRAAAEGKP